MVRLYVSMGKQNGRIKKIPMLIDLKEASDNVPVIECKNLTQSPFHDSSKTRYTVLNQRIRRRVSGKKTVWVVNTADTETNETAHGEELDKD